MEEKFMPFTSNFMPFLPKFIPLKRLKGQRNLFAGQKLYSKGDKHAVKGHKLCFAGQKVSFNEQKKSLRRKKISVMFIIEDEWHCEQSDEYASFDEALTEIKRRAAIPWNQPPNTAPCTSWRTCGRLYIIIEYDDSHLPWTHLRRTPVMEISASGVKWESGFGIPTSGAGESAAQGLLRPSDANELS